MPPHIRHTAEWVLVRAEVVESFVAAVDLASKYLLLEVLIVMINSLSRSDLEILPCGVGVGVAQCTAAVWDILGRDSQGHRPGEQYQLLSWGTYRDRLFGLRLKGVMLFF